MVRRAECCCGDIAIEVSGDPVTSAICHCPNCKKRTGSAFGMSFYFPEEAVVARHGEPRTYAFDSKDSDSRQVRYFCGRCGSTLFWEVSIIPGKIGIAGGCFLDEPPKPDRTVSTEFKYSWLEIADHQ